MKLIIGDFNITGQNEIDIPKTIKLWDDRFILSECEGEYRLTVYRKRSQCKLFASGISEPNALELINRLGLLSYKLAPNSDLTFWRIFKRD